MTTITEKGNRMKKSLTKNYIYNLAYQILILILPLITTPYISRVLGAENIGIYSYTISISAYFILFGSLGIALYGQREIAILQNDKNKCSKTFWEIVILRTITMFISLAIFYFTFVIGNNDYSIYYKILIFEIIGNILDISWFFQGMEEFKKTVGRNTIVKLISVVSIFVFVKNQQDLPIYFVIHVLSIMIGNMSLWLYLLKYLSKVKFKDLRILKHIKPTLSLLIPQIAVQVYTLLDKTMIGAIISDKSEVGYYEQAQKIVKISLTIITSLGTVMMPRIANTFAEGNKEKVNEYMKKSFNMVFLLAFAIILGLIAVADSFVPVFFGDGYEKVAIIMKVISPIVLLIGLSNVTGTQYLLPIKRQKEYTISVVCGAIVNFIFNLIMIPIWGSIGASIGTVIAEATVTIVQIWFVRKDFNLFNILKLSKNYVISSLIMYICCTFIGNLISSNTLSVVIQVITGILVYGISLLIFKDRFVLEFLEKKRKSEKK